MAFKKGVSLHQGWPLRGIPHSVNVVKKHTVLGGGGGGGGACDLLYACLLYLTIGHVTCYMHVYYTSLLVM